jgi:hypothetical protein
MAKKKAASRPAPVATQTDSKYKIVKNVTMPSYKFVIGVPAYLKLTGPHFEGKTQKAKPGEAAMEPATVAPAINVETGECVQLIMGAALLSIIDEGYPDDAYVGKAFRIVKHDKAPGKRYFTYSVDEIEA